MQITMEGRVSLEPAANVTAKIRAQEGKGTLTFDKQGGRLISSRGTQKTEIVIVAQGHEGDQTTDTTSVMTPTSKESQTTPCFFILLKNVLRGMPSSFRGERSCRRPRRAASISRCCS